MGTVLRFATRLNGFIFDLVLGLFLVGLLLVVWLPARMQAGQRETHSNNRSDPGTSAAKLSVLNSRATHLLAVQGTPIVATINGSIDGTEPTFTGLRHFRSGVPGDRNCRFFAGSFGTRPYDEYRFISLSATVQRVSVGFTSGCGNNTYTVAYSPQFDATSICTNYVAGAGRSGSVNWDFTVCASNQFSIVVYGLEPGLSCVNYSFTVYADNAVFLGGPTGKAGSAGLRNTTDHLDPGAMDVVVKKHKRKIPGTDTKVELVLPKGVPPPIDGLLAAQGTPLVAVITDSISTGDPSFTGQRHFLSGIAGDGNCSHFGQVGSRFYDEIFFRNNSPNIETVEVQPTGFCVSSRGPVLVMAAYSPQFNPNDICDGFIAVSVPVSGPWRFRVCPNTQFSIVVYGAEPAGTCERYSYAVFASSIQVTLLGTSADLSITKTGPAGPVPAGSNITYNITFANNGPQPAGAVVFSDPLPAGTTFISLTLLSNLGTALPAPVCMTPPVGSPGTVTCSLNLLSIPGTGLPNSITYALTVRVGPQAGASVTNTAFVTHQGFDPNLENNSSSVTTTIIGGLDLCLQDDSSKSVLRFSSATGDYIFTNCQGVTVSGRGTITIQGSIATLQHSAADRRILARIDSSVRRGSATVQLFSPTRIFTITDKNTADNTCACQ